MVHHTNFNNMNQRGFTLIELLIAIAMIGILAATAIIMINPLEQIKKGRDAQRKYDLLQIRNVLEAYNSDNNLYPTNLVWGSTWLPYMAKVPKDQLSSQNYYYKVADDHSWYRLYARLERCADPQILTGAECTKCNYSVTSSNVAPEADNALSCGNL